MPRASGSSKRQSGGVGHRDGKHENGLVASNKRAQGKKNLPQSEGPAKPADHGGGLGHAGPSLPAHPVPTGASSSNSKGHHFDAAASLDARPTDARRPSLGTYSEASSESCTSTLGANGGVVVDGTHRQIDVNAMKNADVHRDSGPIEMVATVLKSLPMQDTLAILIILMQLPSLSLSFLYVAFTCLTFVPPVTTSSGINLNFAEIFDGHYTMPSLVTVLCMDFFFLLIWLFLWQPIQDTILDLAKPVIAITLGGGTASRDGSSRGITTCFAWVILNHLIRGTRTHWARLVRHVPDDWRLPNSLSSSLEQAAVPTDDRRSTLAWIRSALAIHILTQGLVRYIREWYLRRERANAAAGPNDPEAGKSLPTITGPGDASAHDASFFAPDTEVGFAPASNASMSKKRRKQSTQVRLQQPLWAALASTKIVVMKEYESTHVPSESQGTNATDIHNLGSAPFNTQLRQIWVSYIGSDEVCFNTSHFPSFDDDTPPPMGHGHGISRPTGVDTSKPFYVRVNNAFWQPTRIFAVEEPEDDAYEGTRWTGDIYGLRPLSKYVCEFVDSWTDKVIFSTSIRTVKEPTKESKTGSVTVKEPQPSLQPDSPATTLRTSIAAAEAKLADEKNRLKTWRKEWKSRINTLKRENELTDNQLLSAGNSDDKFKQKIRQQETQRFQAERDTERLAGRLKNFDNAPELSGDGRKKVERAYAAQKKLYDAAQRSFKEHKSGMESQVQAKEVEKANLNTRRNKIATRIAKVENELANITDANNRGLDEVERRRQEREMWRERVLLVEKNYSEQLAHVFAMNTTRSEHVRSLQAQVHGFQTYLNAVNGMSVDMSAAGEGAHPGFQQAANAWSGNAPGAGHFAPAMWPNVSAGELLPPVSITPGQLQMSGWQTPAPAPQPPARAFEPRASKARGRSSSMLSDVSGFTQSSHEERGSLRPLFTRRLAMNGSRGSSGSGSGSIGSMGDPSSPA